MMTRRLVCIVAMFFYLLLAVSLVSAQVPADGRTTTLLPNGSLLVAGGQDAGGHASAAIFLRDSFGSERQLQAGLQIARTGHTATVLPDGTVFILGGVGMDGQLVQAAEIFDPQTETSQLLNSGSPAPRAFHTATLLADGRVLIAGGVGASGQSLVQAEFWDSRQRTSVASGTLLSFRRNQSATLLADGRVLLVGGKDENGNPLSSAEVFDPQSQTFSAVTDSKSLLPPGTGNAPITATSLQDGATAVPVDALISVLFSRAARIESINEQTLILNGPLGMVEAKVTGAEAGMLGFIVPRSPLLPGTTYMVRLSGISASNGNNTAFKEFTFTTAGETPPSDLWAPTLDWMTHNGPSAWQNMPPLQARPGVTALAGQVLKLDGTPLAHVKLQIGTQAALSDGTGRFLLTNIPTGHSVMMIFGDSANTPLRKYGVYEVGVNVQPGVTNVLPYVIWMTALDTAHAVRIPSPTSSETVITTPLLPGLELHLPANTVITDSHGNPVTEITITPVPLDRPPFPLPRVPVPIYFTIQPGAAYIKVMNASGPKGARLFYPNAHSYPPGTPFQFWNYDASQKGWFIYGEGKVSADRSQIIPNPGVEIYEFTGAMVSNPGNGPPNGPHPGDNNKDGDPVDLSTGLFVYQKTDLMLPDIIPLALTRTYRQNDPMSRAFGIGASQPYDMFMVGDNNTFPEGYTFQDLILADGTKIHFPRISPCTGANGYCDFGNAVYEHTSSGTDFYGAIIRVQSCSPNGFWTLTKKDGTVYCFPDSDASNNARAAAPTSMRDRYGNSLTFTRDSNHNLTQITSPGGRWIQFTYDSSNRITQAKDNIGRTVTYSYDAGGRLAQVIDANGGTWNYTYDAFNELLSIQDARGIFYLTNQYDQNGRVIRQTQADNTTFLFSYTTDPVTGNITQTDVTGPRGIINRSTFTANGYTSSRISAVGKPEQQSITYNRDPNTNLISSVIDALSRTTTYTYDSLGNLTSITRMSGTPGAATTSYTYEPSFNQLASITDPLNHTTTFSYDLNGSMTVLTDPLGHQTNFAYNPNGLPISMTDALSRPVQFTYDGTDLVGITDPLGNTTTRFVDSVGRIAVMTNAAGQATRYSYNTFNELLQITDPLQGVTSFSYDVNGNRLSMTDPMGHSTSWSYNNQDRMATRLDALSRQESYTYDLAGNLVSVSDRKGQVTTYGYDNLNRLNFVGFGTHGSGSNATYDSTISYTYDSGNRLTQAVDSVGGTITRGYDNFDRMISETSPQGSISYSYDAAGRRASMAVSGQPVVSYTYDNAGRLLQMTQGSSNVNFNYDDANRRSSLTLPNGVNVSYTYDSNSNVTGISYNSGVNTLGNLSYSYDQAGRRTSVSGSFGRTGLPQAVVSTSYDAANELLNWNGSSISYDANGNMLSDGTHTFTWDARNHLVTIDNGATASFVYDAFGRRASKTMLGATTAFSFDRFNVVQETTGANVANSLTGGVDEVFQRSDAAGPMSFLNDASGSTLALTDSTGVSQAQYSYDPFGNTSPGGAGSTNSFAYTGRELDATGLYFYRARYYNPSLQRFISEDPAQLQGGSSNFYAYAADAPTQYKDPSGRCLPTAVAGAALGLGLNGLYNLAHRKDFFRNGLVAAGLGAAAGCGIGLLADLFGAGAAAAETSVFWSGGAEAEAAATAWAEANGGITLGMTEAGQATELATQGLDWAVAKPMWAATSADFASAASGDVVAFINAAGYSAESIFGTVELGALLSNPAVTSITIIFF